MTRRIISLSALYDTETEGGIEMDLSRYDDVVGKVNVIASAQFMNGSFILGKFGWLPTISENQGIRAALTALNLHAGTPLEQLTELKIKQLAYGTFPWLDTSPNCYSFK